MASNTHFLGKLFVAVFQHLGKFFVDENTKKEEGTGTKTSGMNPRVQ